MSRPTLRLRSWTLVLAAGLFRGPAPMAAQGIPIRDLRRSSRETADPFSLIVAAREYRPGQLLVSDGVEAEVALGRD